MLGSARMQGQSLRGYEPRTKSLINDKRTVEWRPVLACLRLTTYTLKRPAARTASVSVAARNDGTIINGYMLWTVVISTAVKYGCTK